MAQDLYASLSQNPLRLDRRRHHLPGAADRRRHPLDSRHPDGAAEEEFHWSRATIALAVSINLILYGCIGPFAAAVMERFGIRRSVLCALTLVGVGVASTSLMRQPWQLILMWGFLVGSGTGFLATVLSATIATRWFTARRGLVIGI